jgi:hydrogenase nickel incorporation protein HypA/HybF
MHEVSLVQSLLARVASEAVRHGARSVAKIHLRVGELSGVEPALLASAFELCRDGVAAAAELVLTREPAEWRCGRCGDGLPPGARLCCASCGGVVRLVGGDALLLERLEMEVAEASPEPAPEPAPGQATGAPATSGMLGGATTG